MPGPLYRNRQQALMTCTVTRYAARDNFAPFIGKSLQQPVIMVVDDINLIFAKAAYPLSSSVKISHFVPL